METMKQILNEFRKYLEEGAKKPNCSPGQANHDWEGKFTDPYKDKGSWSIQKQGPHSSSCKSGQGRRMRPNKSVQFTSTPCGRKPGGGKYNRRCRDGSKIWEEEVEGDLKIQLKDELRAYFDSRTNLEDEEGLQTIYEKVIQTDKGKKLKCRCPTFADFLSRLNAVVASTKGDLYKQRKKA